MIRRLLSVGSMFMVAIGSAQAAGDPAAGKAISTPCAACHGPNGEGKPSLGPKLTGKSEDELLQALKDYKSGKKDNAMMKAPAANLTDQDMANLAAYYASLK